MINKKQINPQHRIQFTACYQKLATVSIPSVSGECNKMSPLSINAAIDIREVQYLRGKGWLNSIGVYTIEHVDASM